MKKSILLLMPLFLALSGCNKASSIPNKKEVDAFKALLNEQDLSEFHQKWFASQFTNEYSILDIEEADEDEYKITNFFNYTGIGWLNSYYILSDDNYDSLMDDYGEINIFDAMSKGVGGYRIIQSSDAASYVKEPAEDPVTRTLSVLQSTTLKTTESDVFVNNTLFAADTSSFNYEERQEFNGKIGKDLLFSTVSTRSFREIFSSVNLFGAPEEIEHLDSLYYSTCRDLKNRSDKEISDFIIDKKIEMSEEENYLDVKFSFDGEQLEDNESMPGVINGILHFDKETHSFAQFEYEIEFVNESVNEETNEIIFATMRFTCAGVSSHEQLGSLDTKDDPTVYDDVTTFLEDVIEQVVPPTLY